MFQIARDNGFSGDYIRLEQLICAEAERAAGKSLPVNATGAISCELGLPWKIVRGIGVLARDIGLVGHILEESNNPIAVEIWQRVEDEATRYIRPQGVRSAAAGQFDFLRRQAADNGQPRLFFVDPDNQIRELRPTIPIQGAEG